VLLQQTSQQGSTRQAATNAIALLSTVRNQVLEKNAQGIWQAG